MTALAPSTLDSERFGLRVLRGTVSSVEPKLLASEILAAACDVAIVRVPSTASARMAALTRWSLPILHADTLVYYKCDLTRYQPKPLRNTDIEFSVVRASDLAELRLMIASTFENYQSHYHANPLFPPDKILAGYQQWAENHVTGKDRTLWTVRRNGRLAAFAACQDRPNHDEAEGILYGVSPQDAGGGLYGDLIRHTQADARRQGRKVMKVSTQVGNFAVQKVWAREGFHLFEALDTFHVNALLTAGPVVVDREVSFDAEMIEKFAQVSGDANPIHMSDEAARDAGFPSRIVHGVIAASEFSRILGTEVPGTGTVFGNLNMSFLQPLMVGQPYRLQMRIPGGVRAGPMHAVMAIRDRDERLCCLARSDIFLKR